MNKRFDNLQNIIVDKTLDGVILTDGYNIDYLSGYKGHTGMLLVLGQDRYILTDSRYTEQAASEAREYFIIDIGMDGYSKTVKRLVEEKYSMEHGECESNVELNIGFEDKSISYSQYRALADVFDNIKVNLVHLEESVNKLRMIKSAEEIELIAKAEAIGDEAFNHIINFMEVGMTEKQVALELEVAMKSLGADGLSFDTIVASGKNSSMPHAVPTDKVIEDGDFVTMDFGCVYKGYCSDMTRTVYMGDELTEKQLEVYTTVLAAQKEALKAIKPGVVCSDIDKIARDYIAAAGYGDCFGHGLGHGVGLFIHEEPRFSRTCDEVLVPGMVLSVEPGIYLPGEFGVRIEDLIVVTEDGYENLAASPKVLILM
ncbi:MAG: aminopeptidase P family protein [Lachnospiraceae bacterium]|nr:aminopeptidase P family protein [Lachnospiraceae bacterium]